MHPFVLGELARERRSELLALAVERAVQRGAAGPATWFRRRLERLAFPGLSMRPCCPAS